jgi:GNAT superfamily N-acetyltransferase
MRILVDHYHDSGWSGVRRELSSGPERITICREPLKWSVLRRYHVVIIDATAPARVGPAELKAVERFVAEGGGLLVAGSAPQFELVTGDGPSKMPAARFAERFGARFVPAEDSGGELQIDREFRVGYHEDDVAVTEGVVEGFGPHPPGAETWTPLRLPDGARPLLVHRQTGEPLAGLTEHGSGRVCVCAVTLERFNVLAHLQPLLRALAPDPAERGGDDLPVEIGPPPTARTVHGLKLICDEPVVERADELAGLIRRFDEFMVGVFGTDWATPSVIRVLQTSRRPRPWDDGLFLAATGPRWALAYNAALAIANAAVWHRPSGHLLVSLFPEATVARHLALRFLDHLGFADEADRLRDRLVRALDASDPSRTRKDLSRIYAATEQWHPGGAWLLAELERRSGDDLLGRLFEVLPKKREEDRLLAAFAWPADRLAYYLGLAAGEDLSEFLAQIGTTVHPLPLVRPDDDGFDAAMRGVLVEALLADAPAVEASRRIEALSDLSRLKPEERAELPDRARSMVEAFERSVASDERAAEPLEALAAGDQPEDAAWAALQLVTMGRSQWADRLAGLLPGRDLRFRLMGGHALRRLGREAPEGSLEGLTDGGTRVGELEIAARDMVIVHAKVEGYEIANVLAESGLSGFPHGHWATRFYVYWVHTSPQWRRSGLSRRAFAAAMQHEEALRCSCFALNTGTRNNAHALYRDFGYVDMDRRERAVKLLCLGTPCVSPDGVVIRPIGKDDRETVRRYLLDYHDDAFTLSPLPVPHLGEGTFAALAERDGELVGVALASHEEGDRATLLDVAVREGEEARAEIGAALLARVHTLLAGDGARRVTADVCSDAGLLTDVLCRCGYSRESTGDVNMFGIRDLAQLLGEIRPLFERRLRKTPFEDWRGRVILLGERLRSGLEFEDGSARVLDTLDSRPTDIALRTTDERITRIVTGRETPLEGYLQRETTVEPQVSPPVMRLLETLFPRMPFVLRWGW